MICPQCKAENRDGAKFCDECGTRLVEPRTPECDAHDAQAAADGGAVAPCEGESPEAASSAADAERDPSRSDDAVDAPSPEENASQHDEEAPTAADTGRETVSQAASADKTAHFDAVAKHPASEASQTRRIDLSGLDEYALPGSFTPPSPSWRDGGTMRLPRIEEKSPADDRKSFRAPSSTKKNRRGLKIALGVILGVVLLAAAGAFATYQMQLWGGKVVPDVVGLTQADATNTLESKGFSVRPTQVKSDETEGIVLLMDPGSGSRLDAGGEVVIHIAVGRSIPQVVGKQRSEAEAAIAAEGLSNVTYVTQRSDEEEGVVLSIEPAEGERARANTAVTVTVAEPFTVPDIEGMTQDEASAALAEAGYAPYIEYVNTEEVAEGTVMGSDPGAGERVPSGSDVAIRVAQSRATQLSNATYSLFTEGTTVTIDGVSYTVNSCDAVTYQGGDTTAYTITATPFTYFLGVYLPLNARQVSGTITWTADNTVASGQPAIALG